MPSKVLIPRAFWWLIFPAGALLLGTAGGLLNGFLVAYVRLPALVVTLGTFAFYRGIVSPADGKAGLMTPEAAELAGPGLKAVCQALGIPPVLHLGSCVDNTRILVLAAALANYLGVDISQIVDNYKREELPEKIDGDIDKQEDIESS